MTPGAYLWFASAPAGRFPLGAYGEPPPDDAMPPLSYIFIGDNVGPFRTREYARGFKALTRFRDWAEGWFP